MSDRLSIWCSESRHTECPGCDCECHREPRSKNELFEIESHVNRINELADENERLRAELAAITKARDRCAETLLKRDAEIEALDNEIGATAKALREADLEELRQLARDLVELDAIVDDKGRPHRWIALIERARR